MNRISQGLPQPIPGAQSGKPVREGGSVLSPRCKCGCGWQKAFELEVSISGAYIPFHSLLSCCSSAFQPLSRPRTLGSLSSKACGNPKTHLPQKGTPERLRESGVCARPLLAVRVFNMRTTQCALFCQSTLLPTSGR